MQSLETHRGRRQGMQLRDQPACPPSALRVRPAALQSRRRRSGAMAVLAVLPVHAIYAGFVLRESLVALTAILAIWTLDRGLACRPRPAGGLGLGRSGGALRRPGHPGPQHRPGTGCRGRLACPVATGPSTARAARCSGRVTAAGRDSSLGPGHVPRVWMHLSILIQAISNTISRGPFTTTSRGTPGPTSFTRWPMRRRSSGSSSSRCFIIAVYSTMILGLPLVAGAWLTPASDGTRMKPGRDVDLLVATHPGGVRAGDAQEHSRRDAGRPAWPVLSAGLRAGLADGGCGRDRPGCERSRSSRERLGLAGRDASSPWSGPTRPGPTTPRGWSSPISFTGRPSARRATGSRPIPSAFRRMPGS